LRGKRKDGTEETLGSLLRRRLGDEATDMAVAPLLAGLYAGDVDRLSALATFPELVAWEATQGSLIRGSQAAMRSARRGTPTPMFVKPKGGVGRLTDTLAASLGDRVVTGAPVGSLADVAEGGDVTATVLAVPAFEAARLVEAHAQVAGEDLRSIPYASTGVVFLVFGEGTQASLPGGTGFVVPRGKAPMTACTWISSKWPDPAFGSRAVVRCYVGGVGDDDVLEASDDELVDACVRHLSAVLDLPERPEASSVVRWMRAMPQYEVGHVDRVAAIRRSLPEGIFVVGSAYDGVGIPDCVRGAGETAEQVLSYLDRATIEKETAR
jgi:oxygen-dependent protoporphyrinogen oxidase